MKRQCCAIKSFFQPYSLRPRTENNLCSFPSLKLYWCIPFFVERPFCEFHLSKWEKLSIPKRLEYVLNSGLDDELEKRVIRDILTDVRDLELKIEELEERNQWLRNQRRID